MRLKIPGYTGNSKKSQKYKNFSLRIFWEKISRIPVFGMSEKNHLKTTSIENFPLRNKLAKNDTSYTMGMFFLSFPISIVPHSSLIKRIRVNLSDSPTVKKDVISMFGMFRLIVHARVEAVN